MLDTATHAERIKSMLVEARTGYATAMKHAAAMYAALNPRVLAHYMKLRLPRPPPKREAPAKAMIHVADARLTPFQQVSSRRAASITQSPASLTHTHGPH